MRQEINLYGLEFRRQQQPVNGRQIALASLGFFAVLMVIEGAVAWQWFAQQERLATVNAQHAEVSQRLNRLKQSQPLSQRPRLEAQVQSLQEQVQRREELQSIIAGQNLGNSEGFSHYLESLARQTLPDVALGHIRLLRGGAYVEFDGHARNAESVPAYLQNLRDEESFREVKFGVLMIRRDEANGSHLLFSLGKTKDKET